jgi:hypothetical protein
MVNAKDPIANMNMKCTVQKSQNEWHELHQAQSTPAPAAQAPILIL